MMKKNKLHLTAITVLALAFLLILPVSCLSIPTETGETTSGGTETSNGPSASSEAAGTPTSDEKDENLIFLIKRGYVSATGCPTILGEVTNVGNFTMKDILITASFYCSKGKLIGAKEDLSAIISGHTELEILAPGETSPFKIALSAEELSMLPNFDVDKVEKYTVVVSNYNTTDEELYKGFEISQSSGGVNNVTGHYEVVGRVKNNGNETAEQIKIVGTFYDNETNIIEVMHTYLQAPLLPGDEAQFEITVPGETISQRIKTFYIQAAECEEG